MLYPASLGRCIVTPWKSRRKPWPTSTRHAIAARIRAGHEDRRAALGGQAVTRVDQQPEHAFRIGARPDGTELDIARA